MSDPIFKVGDIVRTRGGGTARVICTDARGGFPVVALHAEDCAEFVRKHTVKGNILHGGMEAREDLLPPAPPKSVKVRRWLLLDPTKIPIGLTALQAQAALSEASSCRNWRLIQIVVTLPPDIAAQCKWLKDAEIVEDGE